MVRKIAKVGWVTEFRRLSLFLLPMLLIPVAAVTFLLAQNQQDIRQRASSDFGKSQVLGRAETDPRGLFAKGEILLRFKDGVEEDEKQKTLKRYNATQIEEIGQIKLKRIRVNDHALPHILEALKNNPNVDFAEPNEIAFPEVIPNDSLYSSQWQHPKIIDPLAWDLTMANNILIGVCDTGFEATHPDLQPILRADLGWNSADGSTDWSPIASHGTMVAGIAAAAANNGIGVAGVAWGAQVIPVRITNFTDGSAYISDAAKCITYSADKGAKAINLSYRMAGSLAIDSAGKYAQGKGALTFVAAGNEGKNPGYTSYPGFIAVSSTTSSDTLASTSSYGSYVDISAPGNNVYTTRTGGTYGAASGTSMASPMAAGVGALIYGAKPTLTALEAQNILFQSATDLGSSGHDIYFGWGRVNSQRAVSQALETTPGDTTPPQVSITSPANGSTVAGKVSITANATDNLGVARVQFYIDGNFHTSDSSSPYSVSWDTTKIANGNHTLRATAYDFYDNIADSQTITVTVNNTPDTIPPTANVSRPLNGEVVSGDKVAISATTSDDRGVVSVDFKVDGSVIQTLNTSCGSCGVFWQTSGYSAGSHTIQVTAYDLAGNAGHSQLITVTLSKTVDTTPPTANITSPSSGSTVGGSVTVGATASDNVSVTKVELFIDGMLRGSNTTAPYSFFWDTQQYNNGSHSLVARAYDAAGNTGDSAAVSVNVSNVTPTPLPTSTPTPTPTTAPPTATSTPPTPDTTTPSVTISSPADGEKVKGNVRINATAADNIGVVKMEIYIDGSLKSSSGGSSISTAWNVNAKNVSSGTHTIEARAYDAAGNIGTKSIVVTK